MIEDIAQSEPFRPFARFRECDLEDIEAFKRLGFIITKNPTPYTSQPIEENHPVSCPFEVYLSIEDVPSTNEIL